MYIVFMVYLFVYSLMGVPYGNMEGHDKTRHTFVDRIAQKQCAVLNTREGGVFGVHVGTKLLFFSGGYVPPQFPKVESRERVFLEK